MHAVLTTSNSSGNKIKLVLVKFSYLRKHREGKLLSSRASSRT